MAREQGISNLAVSLTHEGAMAAAVVVAVCGGDGAGDRRRRRSGRGAIAVESQIREILSEHARLPVEMSALDDDADLYQAGMTSHASVSVMLALEDTFDIEFPESMLRKSTFESVSAISAALTSLVGAPAE